MVNALQDLEEKAGKLEASARTLARGSARDDLLPQFGPKLPLNIDTDAARAASNASVSRNFAGIASVDDLLPSQRTRCQPLLELLSMTPRRCLHRA